MPRHPRAIRGESSPVVSAIGRGCRMALLLQHSGAGVMDDAWQQTCRGAISYRLAGCDLLLAGVRGPRAWPTALSTLSGFLFGLEHSRRDWSFGVWRKL